MTKLTNRTLRETTSAALAPHALLNDAEDAQWRRSLIAADTDDDVEVVIGNAVNAGTIRVKRVGDPTFDAASDPTRLALRGAVIQAE